MNPRHFRKLLKKVDKYYHKLVINIYNEPVFRSRNIANIIDTNYISFRESPKFRDLELTEDQEIIINQKVIQAEQVFKRQLVYLGIIARTFQSEIENRRHN